MVRTYNKYNEQTSFLKVVANLQLNIINSLIPLLPYSYKSNKTPKSIKNMTNTCIIEINNVIILQS